MRAVLSSRLVVLSRVILHSHGSLAYVRRLDRGWAGRVIACANWTGASTLLNGAGWQGTKGDRLRSRSGHCLRFFPSLRQKHRPRRFDASIVDWPRDDALSRRFEFRSRYGRLGELVRIYTQHVLRHWTRRTEISGIHRGHPIFSVGVPYVVVIMTVIVILDVYHAGHANVGDVHLIYVPRTAAVPRGVGLARPQREPCGIAVSATDANADSEMRTANKSHQCGRPDGSYRYRPRHPSPAVAYIRPAPIVERRISPGLVRYPCPSPGACPDPVPITIRHPSHRHISWIPDGTVLGLRRPIAIIVQVVITGRVAAYILGRLRVFQAAIAIQAPAVKLIDRGHLHP